MGMLRKDQTGFSAVETVLVLVIVALVGVVGCMVYNNHNKNNAPVASTQTKSKPTTTKPEAKKDYLVVSELGLKFDKSNIPTAYYKISESERQRAYPQVPELKMVLLYDKKFDDTKNSKGQTCGSSQYGSEIAVVQVMSVADRDKGYAQYKDAALGPNDDVPTVVSNKYAKRVGDYLYDYYKAQGVQGLIGCIDSEDAPQDKQAEAQYNASYQKMEQLIMTIQKS